MIPQGRVSLAVPPRSVELIKPAMFTQRFKEATAQTWHHHGARLSSELNLKT